MNGNKVIKEIREILKHEHIEILDIANERENEMALSFMYKGNHIYITKDGRMFYDKLNDEDKAYIEKIVRYACKMVNVDFILPIANFKNEETERRYIDNIEYYLIMKIKNQCLFYRDNGVLGITYIICEQKQVGNSYEYNNINNYTNLRLAEEYFAYRSQLIIKPMNIFNRNELNLLLYCINLNKENEMSKNLQNTTKLLQTKIINLLKEYD